MKKISITIIWLILLAGGIRGQELMTLEQAVSIGLTNNYDIIISRNSVEEARNNASPGNAGMLPKVQLNSGYTKSLADAKMKVVTGSDLNVTNAHADLVTAGAGLNWRLFDGMNMFITLDKLRKLEEISDLSARITIENTVAKIIAAYYEIVRQGRVQQMLKEQVGISEFRLGVAKMRFETGTGSEMDFLKSRVELNADIANLSSQTTLFENSKTTLNDLLARNVTTGFSVTDSIPAAEPLSYDSLLVSLKAANRNLMLTNKNKQVGELDVKSSRASQWPTLDYYAGFNYLRNETQAHFIQYNRNYGPSMGLTLNLKLFDGLNQRRQYKNSLISLKSFDLGVKQMENRLEADLAKIFNEYRDQLEMIGFEMENLRLALRNMELAKESYAIGSISSLQLREVQDDLLTARNRLVTAQYNVKLTETELLLLSGKLVN